MSTYGTALYGEAVYGGGDAPVLDAWVPTAAQVAALLRARTRGVSSRDAQIAGEQDAFTATTRPTLAQVNEIIGIALGDMYGLTEGRSPCTTRLSDSFRTAALYRACQIIEASYFPEQTNTDQTAFDGFQKMWESASKVAASIIDQCPLPGEDPTDPTDLHGYPIGRTPVRCPTTWFERW